MQMEFNMLVCEACAMIIVGNRETDGLWIIHWIA
jgi:hypothetical protein